MGVTEAKIQTVEDIYRLVRTAVVSKRAIRALYHRRERWCCPHRMGWNRQGQTRVLCYQYRGETVSELQNAGSPSNLALYRAGEVEQSRVARRYVAHSSQLHPPTDLRCGSRGRRGRLAGPRGSAKGTMRQLPKQVAGDGDSQGGDGGRVMPLGANAATLAGGSSAAAGGLIIQHGRRGLRGKKGSSR